MKFLYLKGYLFRFILLHLKVLNPVNFAPGDDQHVTVAELKALADNLTDWTGEPDMKFYLAYDFYAVNNWHFHDSQYYPIFGGI